VKREEMASARASLKNIEESRDLKKREDGNYSRRQEINPRYIWK